MNSTSKLNGSCLCGSVRVEATPKSHSIGACHCDMCRKWGGMPFLAAECEDNVRFTGDEHIAVYSSSEWAERGFCKQCGTHLFYRLKQAGHYAISIGLFDDADWTLSGQIFIDRKPSFYSFAEKTMNMTGDEVFAQFAGKQ